MSKPISVFHKSSDGQFLVEVRQFKVFYATRRWARQHPNAFVYVRINVGADADPVWCTFGDKYGPNTVWSKLSPAEVARLPEVLEGLPA